MNCAHAHAVKLPFMLIWSASGTVACVTMALRDVPAVALTQYLQSVAPDSSHCVVPHMVRAILYEPTTWGWTATL